MAITGFPASSIIPQQAYLTVKGIANLLKTRITNNIENLSIANVDYDYLREIYRTIERANDGLNSKKNVPGIVEYAKEAESNAGLDIVAEFSALQQTMSDALEWINNNVPLTATVKPPSEWGDGTLIERVFTPAQTAGLRSTLQTIVDTIR